MTSGMDCVALHGPYWPSRRINKSTNFRFDFLSTWTSKTTSEPAWTSEPGQGILERKE